MEIKFATSGAAPAIKVAPVQPRRRVRPPLGRSQVWPTQRDGHAHNRLARLSSTGPDFIMLIKFVNNLSEPRIGAESQLMARELRP